MLLIITDHCANNVNCLLHTQYTSCYTVTHCTLSVCHYGLPDTGHGKLDARNRVIFVPE